MKKLQFALAAVSLLFFTNCSKETLENSAQTDASLVNQTSQELLSINEINTFIDAQLQRGGGFNWNSASDQLLWSAAVHGENLLTIGYGNKGESFSTTPNNTRLQSSKNSILETVQRLEGKTRKQTIVDEGIVLNLIDVTVENIATIIALRKRKDIRYIEPSGYSFFTNVNYPQNNRSSSGCNQSPQSLNSADYRSVAPGSLVSWTYDQHNITQAWAHSTGANVTVAVVDTGLSPNQSLLGNNFNDGYSNGRTVQKYGTFIDSRWWWSNNYDGPNDRCGHGTAMAGTIASPRNNDNLPVGVAYNSNLVSYRATEDVLLNDYHERKGVRDALVQLGNRNDVKIISMSIGYPWGIGAVRDGVRYAHNRGKLIFAAGGTSFDLTNWYPVIFPANMSETVAVTGVTDNGNYQQCDSCHDGSEIEFTIVMERNNNNNRTSTVVGFNNGESKYIGGSSVATATTAGIAALVWSKYPNWSREQVLQRMRQSSELYPNRSSTKGYGNIDALQAVQ